MSDKNKLTDKQLRVLIDEYSQSQTYTEYRPSDIANALTELRDRNRKLEQEVEYLQTDVDLRDDDIRNYLEDIKRLEQRLFNRDAAWERAIQSLAEQGVIMVDDPIEVIRSRMEEEEGGGA